MASRWHRVRKLGSWQSGQRIRPEEEPLITAGLIRDFTFTGTRAVLVDRLRALRDAGYRQWAIQVVPGHEDALEDWVRVIEKV